MIGDPNWLYSTIAQSSAAIVAIVGGFITATVLMLLAEKRTLDNQLSEKETRLEALNGICNAMTKGNKVHTKKDLYRIADLKNEIAILTSEVAILNARIRTFSYPPNLGLSIAVLSFMVLFGIFFPVSLIYNQLYVDTARIAAMTAFFAGILALIVYITSLINILRRPPNAKR